MRKIVSILLCIFMLSTLCSCAALSMLNAATSEHPPELEISSQPTESSMPDFSISSQNEPTLSSLSPSSELEISQPPVSSQPAPSSSSMPPASSSKPEPKPSGIKVDLFDGLCTVTLPESWKGRYTLYQDKSEALFCNKKNETDEYGGILFYIVKSSEYKSKKDLERATKIDHMDDDRRLVGGFLDEWSGGIIYYAFATDVECDIDNPELYEDFMSMQNQIDKVLDSLVVNE